MNAPLHTPPRTQPALLSPSPSAAEQVDVLIIGAGISGIGAAHHVRERFPDSSFLILDALDDFGGTWRIHRYPGARSDSDLYTYGYDFKPWRGARYAGAREIRDYMGEVIAADDLAPHIRYGHKVAAANWDSQDQRWTVRATRRNASTGADEEVLIRTRFLWMCAGYYRHAKGYTPDWPDFDRFQGTVVHPQAWPENLDYAGKRIVVIGSGATAATLIPALADKAAHVTMLQRSPTFFAILPSVHELEGPLRALDIPDEWLHEILKRAHLVKNAEFVRLSTAQPDAARAFLIEDVRAHLPAGFDVEKHFSPRYRPWQQRVAVVPDGDLFTAVCAGKASVVTDTIERFDATGIALTSGEHLDADIIITATGFNLNLFGDVAFSLDGAPVDFTQRVTYRGIMIEGIPNMAFMHGYFRSSWTLRVDMVCAFLCRVFGYMRQHGLAVVTPTLRPEDANMARVPIHSPENFNAGYVQRGLHILYRQGDHDPWRQEYDYHEEREILPAVPPDDSALAYR